MNRRTFEPQNLEQGISNAEGIEKPTMLYFFIRYSLFDIQHLQEPE